MQVVVTLIYPLLVYVGFQTVGVRWTAIALFVWVARGAAIRLARTGRASPQLAGQILGIGGLYAVAAWINSAALLQMSPALISFGVGTVFAASLVKGPPLIERFAATFHDVELTPARKSHCRGWTVGWTALLFAQGLGLTWASHLEAGPWAAYVAGVTYPIMGLMFAGEFVQRRARFRDFDPANPIDRWLERLLPGEA